MSANFFIYDQVANCKLHRDGLLREFINDLLILTHSFDASPGIINDLSFRMLEQA